MNLINQLIGGLLETFLIITIGTSLVNFDCKRKFLPLLLISFYGSTVLFLAKNVFPPPIYLFIVIWAIGFLVSFLFKLKISLSMIGISLGSVCLLVAEVIGFSILKSIQPFFSVNLNEAPVLAIALPHLIILTFILWLFRKYKISLIILKKQTKRLRKQLLLISILSFSILFLYYIVIYKNKKVDEYINLFWGVALVTLTMFIFFMIRGIFLQNLRDAEDYLEEQYEELGKYIHFIQKHNHDHMHHLITIKQMLEKGYSKESYQYLSDVLNDSAQISDILPVHSVAISGLLLSYKDKGLKENIHIQYKISDSLRDFPCKLFETNRILGNLITNAIDAVKEIEELPKRAVYVHINATENYYRIDVSNFGDIGRFSEVIERIFEEGFSTKDKVGRGYGLHIVKSVVEKYNGFIFTEIIDRMIIFKVRIPKEANYV
ncbi:GHKL domain-containing protein [Bacillus sp. YC2]|uniref:sensor histidine kinase n=1 Tax=Bacillus sp. YC2 TaxID=2861287 RepID=UPI001CA6C505|nr:GHKL domain-containing protein [Bacillus sp. YC2]MBY8914204.1 GHKL domain-containing protein [Bacillus sp. YC2]